MDAAHDKTDKILSVLEQRIKDTYTRSQAEISESWRRYMDEVDVRVKKLHKAVSDAEDDEQRAKALAEYKRVVRNATLTNERYAAMVQETSERLSHVNEIALVCVNGELPKIYTLNYNETNNGIANAVNGYSFTLLDENTVRNLIESDETLLPLRHLDLAADMRWNTKKINAEVLQGILQGESVADIAARLERVTDMNRVSALRNARTAVTGAENKGRMDGYAQAEKMGVKLKKRWMSALDNRVRHTHRALNGQVRDNDKPFEVDGYEIMYPGDPMAAPEMVYNCRCTTVAEVMGVDELKTGEVKPVWAESMTDEEYSEWKDKRTLDADVKMRYNKKADRVQYERYKALLGSNAPKSFEAFQKVKYQKLELWSSYKTIVRSKNYLQKKLNYVWNGEENFIPQYAEFEKVVTLAGKDSDTAIRCIERLIESYGGTVDDWQKRAGKIASDKYMFDVHWYEKDGIQYEPKLKHRKERKKK